MDRSSQHGSVDEVRGDRGWVLLFFVLSCVLSWAWLVPLASTGGTVASGRGWPTHFPALLGPAVAAVIVTAWRDGRPGLVDLGRRLVSVRVQRRWWLFALGPLLLLAVLSWSAPLLGHSASAPAFAVISGLPATWGLVGVFVAVLLVNGLGEEVGWRGLAQDTLQHRVGAVRSVVVVAVAWALWHAPMFVVVESFAGFDPVTAVGWFIGLFCGAVVLAWLYNRTGRSILLVALWHAGFNMVAGTRAAEGRLAAATTTSVIVLAALLLVLERRAVRRGAPSVIDPAGSGTASSGVDVAAPRHRTRRS